jgi:hypothetical protein
VLGGQNELEVMEELIRMQICLVDLATLLTRRPIRSISTTTSSPF